MVRLAASAIAVRGWTTSSAAMDSARMPGRTNIEATL
jgi:hypothetical protein